MTATMTRTNDTTKAGLSTDRFLSRSSWFTTRMMSSSLGGLESLLFGWIRPERIGNGSSLRYFWDAASWLFDSRFEVAQDCKDPAVVVD